MYKKLIALFSLIMLAACTQVPSPSSSPLEPQLVDDRNLMLFSADLIYGSPVTVPARAYARGTNSSLWMFNSSKWTNTNSAIK